MSYTDLPREIQESARKVIVHPNLCEYCKEIMSSYSVEEIDEAMAAMAGSCEDYKKLHLDAKKKVEAYNEKIRRNPKFR